MLISNPKSKNKNQKWKIEMRKEKKTNRVYYLQF